jgi:hypothetical protein
MEIALKNYGTPDQIVIRDFMYPGCETVEIEVANDGTQSFLCQVIQEECQWIQVNWEQKEIEEQEILQITCRRNVLNDTEQIHRIHLTDGDATVEILIYGKNAEVTTFPEMTFFEQDGIIAIYAEHFAYQGVLPEGEWKVLENYGRVGSAIKAFPVTRSFTLDNSPYVAYRLAVEEEGDYILEVLSAPSNPLDQGGDLAFGVSINEHDILTVPSVSQDYVAGEPANDEWSQGVLNQIHITKIPIQLQKGLNEIRVYAVDPGFVLEELIVYKTNPRESYLGPEESYYLSKEDI